MTKGHLAFPIVSVGDLPPEGTSSELSSLEFKKSVDPSDSVEMAKDGAALANTIGGSILVGAIADGQRLVRYDGIAPALGKRLGEVYERAVKDLCRPTPQLDAHLLVLEPDRAVLAVNVWMSPVAPVGFRVRPSQGSRFESDLWAFPRRVGSQTQYLQPDQFGALENMTARRSAALLLGIPRSDWNQIRVSAIQTASPPNLELLGRLETVSVDGNVAVFTVGPNSADALFPLRVPLDWIQTVWRDEINSRWEVVLDERVFVKKSDGPREWVVRRLPLR